MVKMPQPKRQRSKAEREYAHQLAREEEESAAQYDEDEYSEEEPVF